MNFRQNTRDMPSIPYEERIAQIKRDLMMATQQALAMDNSPTLQRYVTQVEMTVASMQREIDMARYARDDYHRMRDEVWREKEKLRLELNQLPASKAVQPFMLPNARNGPPLPQHLGPNVPPNPGREPTPAQQYQAFDAILAGNAAWRAGVLAQDPDFFERLSKGQKPDILYVGCADSRVSAELLTGCGLGELFVHRNIANLIVNTDMSCLAVIQYAVTVLKVNHIIVCGHYECGGVKAALDAKPLGLIDSWLRNIQDVYRIHKDELDALNYEPRVRRLIELNVMEQALNLYKNMFVQQTQKERRGFPKIHGLVFDLKEGRLKRLDLNIKQYLKKYGSIYTYNPDENAEDRPH